MPADTHQAATAKPKSHTGMTFLGLDAETSARIANITLIVLGALGALVAGFAYRWNDQAQARKDAALEQFQSESKTATALADARSAEANAKAAEAVEGTATAIADAAAAKERTQALEIAAEAQRERAAKAEAEVLAMKARMAPRILSPEQQGAIARAITPFKGTRLNVRFSTEDKEIVDLANQLGAALKAAGWIFGGSIGNDVSRSVSGVVIDVQPNAPANVILAATSLVSSLLVAGIAVEGPVTIQDQSTGMFTGNTVDGAFILLRIGKKR